MTRRRKLRGMAADSPASSARFVGRANVSGKLLARPHGARERNIDLSMARSRLLNRPDVITVGFSYTCDQSLAHRFLHERGDPCLFGGSQLLQREGDRPQGAFVEVCRVAEAERRVPGAELLCALEEADDLALPGIRGHPVPGFRREGWRAGFDDRMEPLGHGALWFRHLGDLREHVAFPFRLVRVRARFRLQLFGALLHRGSFLVCESLDRLADRGGALTLVHENLLLFELVCRKTS